MGFLKDFISLFYPDVCIVCGEGLSEQEEMVCMSCVYKLPKTNYHREQENLLFRNLNSRVELRAATSWCFYNKGNTVQKLVHELKYNGRKELGVSFGKWYGSDLKSSVLFANTDVIIPVPLHPKKLKKRGYNQSECFATGLSKAMGVPVIPDAMKRVKETETQTKKSRYSRWENVQDVFEAAKPELLLNKHVLLVDDIITTGATIETCIEVLKKVPVASVSIASIGYTSETLI